MNKKYLIVFAVVVIAILSPLTPWANNNEIEPNNTEEEATTVNAGTVQAQANDNKDWFKVSIPQTGPVKLRVTGLPAGLPVQVGVIDIAPTGWEDGEGTVEYQFEAKNTVGLIWVSLRFFQTVCGYDWCAARMVEGGPLYGVRPSADMPAEYNGEPILREVPTYILNIEMSGLSVEKPAPPGRIIEEEGDIGG